MGESPVLSYRTTTNLKETIIVILYMVCSTYTVHTICTGCPTDDAKGDKKVLTQFPPFSHKNVRGILQFYRKPTVMSIALRKASSTTLFNLVREIFHNVAVPNNLNHQISWSDFPVLFMVRHLY